MSKCGGFLKGELDKKAPKHWLSVLAGAALVSLTFSSAIESGRVRIPRVVTLVG